MIKLHHGDHLEVLRTMAANSVDSIVCDPPYGLKFMGKKWDYDVPKVAVWSECLRVLKPGGHLLAFAGTRTQHRMACRIEDAGFEIRDMIAWVYGSGFPKSMDVSKAIQKAEGQCEQVEQWEGWGTAMKPSLEPITVARKPFYGTVAANVLEHGTGALNIDRCRVPTDDALGGGNTSATVDRTGKNEGWQRPWMQDAEAAIAAADRSAASVARSEALGRWPANLIHDGSDEVLANFPQSSVTGKRGEASREASVQATGWLPSDHKSKEYTDQGSAARFFYCPKASRRDRNEGLPEGGDPVVQMGATMREREDADWSTRNGNTHPTVKPTDLMAYLCRLVTPPGGVVLDHCMGSGSTGKAAVREGFGFIGIEMDAEHFAVAGQRIEFERLKRLAAANDPCADPRPTIQPATNEPGAQSDLFLGVA